MFRRSELKVLYLWMSRQQLGYGPTQDALAVAVNNADGFDACQEGLVKVLIHAIPGFIGCQADYVKLRREALTRVQFGMR